MATYENKFWDRSGQVFSMKNGRAVESIDLSDVRMLHCGVDTVKQLYNGILKEDVHDLLVNSIGGDVLNIGGIDWMLSRSAKQSGYQFILKNGDLGYVVLVKSFYKDASELGPHIKIEVSPQTIAKYNPDELTDKIQAIAKFFASDLAPSGCAVHLAVDLKNFQVPHDFEKRFVCKAKREFKFDGIAQVSYNGLNEISCVYGDRQTFTYGQPSAVQFSVYNKTVEIAAKDKSDFWFSVWSQTLSVDNVDEAEFKAGDDVKRIEARLHHSVVAQFARGTEGMEEYRDHPTFKRLVPHLNALWRYCLDSFRLQHSYRYVDPLWQMLHEDVRFNPYETAFLYQRSYKTASGTTRRNVAFFIGNFLRVAARRRFTCDFVVKSFLAMGIESELADYFNVPHFGGGSSLFLALTEFVQRRMQQLILDGVAA